MRFALRCIFWLAIVNAAILRDQGYLDPFIFGVGQSRELASDPGGQLATRVADYCRRQPATCLAQAERMRQVVGVLGPDAAMWANGRAQALAMPYMAKITASLHDRAPRPDHGPQ